MDYRDNNNFSPVGLTGGSNLAYGVSVPAQHGREGPDEGEGPDEQQPQDGVLRLQADVPQRPADDEEPLEGQNGEGPQGHDPWSKQQEVSVCELGGKHTQKHTQQSPGICF